MSIVSRQLSRPPRRRREGGSALIVSLVLTFLFLTLSAALLINVERSRAQMVHNLDNNRATYVALSAFEVASSQINDFEFNAETPLSVGIAGDAEGVMRSFHFDNPTGSPTGTNPSNSNVPLPGSLEGNLAAVVGADGDLPTKAAMLQRVDGSFAVRSLRLNDGSWLVTASGKWRREVAEFSIILVPAPGVPFAVGIYGRESLVLQGPGEVRWINSDDENDIDTPVVLEAGEDITVVKTPPPEPDDE